MPKVVIELQANTQQAVQQIQAFAKAQRDAFDAIRAGNPALQDATVKVSKLTEGMKGGAGAVGEFNRAAQSLARGGIRELASQVPIVGDALANLAGTLKGFPGVLLSVVGAGVGVIAWLKSLQEEATKTTERMAALGVEMQNNLRRTQLEVAQGRATRAGDLAGGLSLGAEGAIAAAEQARDKAIAAARQAAKNAQPGMFSPEEFLATGLGITAPLAAKQSLIASELRQKEEAANEAFALTVFKIQERLKTDLKGLEDDYDQKLGESQAKRVESAVQAAEKQARLVEELLSAGSLKFIEGLGAGFEKLTEKLQLDQFVAKGRAAIEQLQAAIAAGMDTNGQYAAGVQLIQQRLDEAVRLGVVPMTQATEQATSAIAASGAAARAASADYDQMAAAAQAAAQAQAALAGAMAAAGLRRAPTEAEFMSGSYPAQATEADVLQSIRDLDQEFQTSQILREAQSTLVNYRPIPIVGSFQHGGVVPGVGPVPILAHGGERVIPAGQAGGAGAVLVRIEPGAVQVSGTVIDQHRSWGVLVEELGQALEARLSGRR